MARVLAGLPADEFSSSWSGFTPAEPKITALAGPRVAIHTVEKQRAGVDLGHILALRDHFRRLAPDVVHVHNFATSVYGVLGARLAGVPTVIYESAGRERLEGPTPRQIAVLRALAPHIDVIVAVSEFLAAEARACFGVGGTRVQVLPTGIDLERFTPAGRGAARAGLDIPEAAFVVGTIGMFRPVKRVEDVLEAGLRFLAARPDAYLLIGGANERGEVPASMWEAARAAGVADRVRLPGRVFGTDTVVPAFDIFINASRFEGASNAIIEALAAGAAIIATRVGGNPDVVDAEETGVLVPAEDAAAIEAALGRLYGDRPLLESMQRRARAVALERHSIQGMVGAYATLFRRCVERRRDPVWERGLRAALGVADGALTWAKFASPRGARP